MILVSALSKSYGELAALDDVSFRVADGEVVGVLGLNGAGKSTLLRILAGELTPSSGAVSVAGVDLAADPRGVRSRVGYLPEGAPLYREMRVRDFLAYLGRINGLSASSLAARIAEVSAVTHIDAVLDRVIDELSLGFRKRVGIAQAILHRPAVLILDEPISALDPAEIVGMRKLVRSLGGSHTVLVSSHILSEVHETCDRILVLHRGRLVDEGSEAALAERLGRAERFVDLTLRASEPVVAAALPDGVTLRTADDLGDGLLQVQLSMDDDHLEAVVAALVDAGVGVRAVAPAAGGLESTFLQLVAEASA